MSSVPVPARPRRGARARFVRRRAWDAVGIVLFVVLVFPVYWMVTTAFKPTDEINGITPTWFPSSPTLDHFRDAMARPFFWDTVKNSLIVVVVAVLASMVIAFLAAVALAKYRFTGRKLFIVAMIGILMSPFGSSTSVGIPARRASSSRTTPRPVLPEPVIPVTTP